MSCQIHWKIIWCIPEPVPEISRRRRSPKADCLLIQQQCRSNSVPKNQESRTAHLLLHWWAGLGTVPSARPAFLSSICGWCRSQMMPASCRGWLGSRLQRWVDGRTPWPVQQVFSHSSLCSRFRTVFNWVQIHERKFLSINLDQYYHKLLKK